jgi:hypothetical protein
VSVRRHLSGLKSFPAILNILSTGADVAGVARYFLAALVNNGNLAEFILQKSNGFSVISIQDSERYVSTSETPKLCLFLLLLLGDGMKLKKSILNFFDGGEISPAGVL